MPRRTFRIALALTVVLLLAAGSASAHDTWLLPSSLRVPVAQSIVLNLTSGMTFPVDDFAIVPSRITRATVRLGRDTTSLANPRSAAMSLRYRWTPARAGVAMIAVELAPKTLSLTPDKVAEYLDEIDAPAALRDSWAKMPAPRRWRESYTKHAATFVRVGNPAHDSTWARPLGLGLEMVPERDPTALRAGDTMVVRALRGGSPIANFVIGARPAGARGATFSPTDANGRARIVFTRAGLWLLAGTDLRPVTKRGLEWESDFSTVTLAVQPK